MPALAVRYPVDRAHRGGTLTGVLIRYMDDGEHSRTAGASAGKRDSRRMKAAFVRVRELLGARLAAPARVSPLEAAFGQLEVRVLESLWGRGVACTVADIHADFPQAAYTTLMTTMDRLFKKAVLQRQKRGRAYAYSPRYTCAELNARLVREAFDVLLVHGERGAVGPLLSTFVEAVSEHDAALLGELERLVQQKRADGEATNAGDGAPMPGKREGEP